MNKYVALSEFEEMLNKKKTEVEEERKPVREPSRPQPNQLRNYPIVVASCCILFALAAGGVFLRVEGEIGGIQSVADAAVKDIGTLKARMAIDNTKEQIATVKAQVDELQAAKMQFEDEVEQMKNILETVKNRANNIRGTGKHVAGGGRKTVARNGE
jgi:hypothetical protein